MAFPPHHGFMFHSSTSSPYHEDNNFPSHDHLPSPSSLQSYPPQYLNGGGNMMMRRSTSFSGVENCINMEEMSMNVNNANGRGDDELSEDEGSQLGEKKKRLNIQQVKALEKSFELGNKLETERKMQLAKALGLQPRQIAIWFQNRRARWKTKQLEKDYDVLKKQFDALKADNDALQAQNKKLHQELLALKGRDCNEVMSMNNIKKENDQGSWSNGSDQNSCDINLDISRKNSTTQLLVSTSIVNNMRPNITSMTELLQGSSNNHSQFVQDEQNLCNMFSNNGSIDGQPGFNWSWPDHHPHATFSLNQPQFSNN